MFFGDNFLLYDAERIYSFVDTLRVNKRDCDSFLDENKKSKYKKVLKAKAEFISIITRTISQKMLFLLAFIKMQGEEMSYEGFQKMNLLISHLGSIIL